MLAPSTESCVVQCLVGRCLMLLPPSSTSHAGSMNTYTEQRDTPPYACSCSTPLVRFAFLFPYVSGCDTYKENTRMHHMATRLLSDSSRSSPRDPGRRLFKLCQHNNTSVWSRTERKRIRLPTESHHLTATPHLDDNIDSRQKPSCSRRSC
jgi:hypothetical protein